jgi:hypothetical protein
MNGSALVARMGQKQRVRLRDGRRATIVRVETRYPDQTTEVTVWTGGDAPEERVDGDLIDDCDDELPTSRH